MNSKNSFIVFSFLLILFISFSACVQQQQLEEEPQQDTEAISTGLQWDSTPVQKMLLLGQSKTIDSVRVTVFSAKKITNYSFLPEDANEQETVLPEIGNVFYLLEASIENLAVEGESIGAEENFIIGGAEKFSLLVVNGKRYDTIVFHGENALPFMGEINAKQKLSGKILFEVPKEFSGGKIQIKYGAPVYWKISQ